MRTMKHGDRAIVAVVGEVDALSALALRHELNRLISTGRTDVVVVLTEVTFMDSTAIAALLGALELIQALGGRMKLVIDDQRVLRVLRIAGLSQVFAIHRSLGDALAQDL